MTFTSWLQVGLLLGLVAILVKPLGWYLWCVFEGEQRPLGKFFGSIEKFFFRVCGIDPQSSQNWRQYFAAVMIFSGIGISILMMLLLTQSWHWQPKPALSWFVALNTAVSFVTNTNWQSYAGETQITPLSATVGLTWQNFVASGTGLAVAIALCRGLVRRNTAQEGIGNFGADLIRAVLYILVPLSLLSAIFFISQGVIQNLKMGITSGTLEHGTQYIPGGMVASQLAIKILGSNGGGFFAANSAHPFENPTAISNLLQMVLMLLLPAALTYTYGKMTGDTKQGWALLIAMTLLLLLSIVVITIMETKPLLTLPHLNALAGNLEGKEVRFSGAASSIYSAITTATSAGSINNSHTSLQPLSILMTLVNMQLGEVAFGGVGCGLYGMIMFVLLAVFLAGLMVGRTPEYLGKKIEVQQIKWAVLYMLLPPMVVLVCSAMAVKYSAFVEHGPHQLTEVIYAYTSAMANNGSALGSLDVSTSVFWNITLTIAMLLGRFGMMLPILAISGSLVSKRTVLPGPGTFPTKGILFIFLLCTTIVLFGALTFFPTLCLGPLLEHWQPVAAMVNH